MASGLLVALGVGLKTIEKMDRFKQKQPNKSLKKHQTKQQCVQDCTSLFVLMFVFSSFYSFIVKHIETNNT